MGKKVQLKEEHEGFWQGNMMYVERETKDDYIGTVVVMSATLSNVEWPKNVCEPYESFEQKFAELKKKANKK